MGTGVGVAQKRSWQGQSTLEYILVLAAIIVAVIVGANSVVNTGVTSAMSDAGSTISGASSKLKTGIGL